jgi:outer membrane protein assembly factor BamB
MAAQLLKRWTEHRAAAQSVAFRSDGRLLASCADDGVVCLWEWKTGRLLWKWEFSGALFGVTFSPDNRHLAVAGEGAVWLCAIPPHTPPERIIACSGEVFALAFSPDGQRFAAGSAEGVTFLWNPQTQLLLGKLSHDDGVHGLAFSPDNRFLATATQDGWLVLWDAQTGHRLVRVFHESGWITSTTFSPDGRWLASGLESGELVVIDFTTGEIAWRREAHARPVSGVAFSPDGRFLVSASADTTVRLWQVPQWTIVPDSLNHQQAVTGVACASAAEPNQAMLLATSSRDKAICCWSVCL